MGLKVRGYAFRTELSLVNRKVVTRFKTDDMTLFNKQVHSALHSAIGTMCRNNLVDDAVGLPTTIRLIVQVRAELIEYFVEILYFRHKILNQCRYSLSTREPIKTLSFVSGKPAYASPRIMRLQRGQ